MLCLTLAMLPLAAVVPTDGLVVTQDTTLEPGTYLLKQGLSIEADGVTLDGNGATLIGYDDTGRGVSIEGRKGVTIKNLKIERFRWGIYAKNADDLTIEGCSIHRTAELPPGGTFLDIWTPPENAYGAAILIWKAKNGKVTRNQLQHQQNGILLYGCEKMSLLRNNASFNSGWGISLYETNDSVVENNTADFCIRVQERGSRAYHAGADATGLLMIMNSNRNKVIRNYFRGGGDGVFVAGFRAPDLKAPCNDNLFEDNDCSLSPNNAFESTFCEGNVFRNNKANNSNFGFWLGYSWKNTIEGNEIRGNRIAGIAIEHGNNTRIENNTIASNRDGVLLWSDGESHFGPGWPEMIDSYTYTITGNTFDANRIGVHCITGNGWWGQDAIAGKTACRDYTITQNTFSNNRTGVRLVGVADSTVSGNSFDARHEKSVEVLDSKNVKQEANSVAEP
ncbi:MAG: hypothetical protein AMXMBFR61_20950 [Fimbriimonadales bacterium]